MKSVRSLWLRVSGTWIQQSTSQLSAKWDHRRQWVDKEHNVIRMRYQNNSSISGLWSRTLHPVYPLQAALALPSHLFHLTWWHLASALLWFGHFVCSTISKEFFLRVDRIFLSQAQPILRAGMDTVPSTHCIITKGHCRHSMLWMERKFGLRNRLKDVLIKGYKNVM